MKSSPARGLPLRIAVPIIVVFAAVFLGVMTYFLRIGLGSSGTALGSNVEQGDARIAATPAPTEEPGLVTIPQTGGGAQAPGNAVGGGPPAPVLQELTQLRARLARDPRDLDALVTFGNLELDAGMYERAEGYFRQALAVDSRSPGALYGSAVAQRGAGLRHEAVAAFRHYLSIAPHDRNAASARAALHELGAS